MGRAPALALVPVAWLGHRGAFRVARFVVWSAALLVVAGAFFPWAVHRWR